MTNSLRLNSWLTADGDEIEFEDILSVIRDYDTADNRIFVGADSMIYTSSCVFATAICLHDDLNKRATYFYQRQKLLPHKYSNLKVRIFKEVQSSIDVGLLLMEEFPATTIEIHIDVGRTHRSKTRSLVDVVGGWVKSLGFGVKLKPHSWASSSVADWHTKRARSKTKEKK